MALFFITCFLVKSAKIKKMKNYYLQTYYDLVPLFMSEGFRLYLVGGAVRDYLLGLKPQDFDLATNATPEEMANFLPNVRVTFARFGNVQFEFANKIFDVTTLRKSVITRMRDTHQKLSLLIILKKIMFVAILQ